MSIKSSGLGCDLCGKPIMDSPYWNIKIGDKKGHACNKCKNENENEKELPNEQ